MCFICRSNVHYTLQDKKNRGHRGCGPVLRRSFRRSLEVARRLVAMTVAWRYYDELGFRVKDAPTSSDQPFARLRAYETEAGRMR